MAKRSPDTQDIQVGQRVRALRLERGMSQTNLAEQLESSERGVVLRELAGGWSLSSHPDTEAAARALFAKPRTPPLTLPSAVGLRKSRDCAEHRSPMARIRSPRPTCSLRRRAASGAMVMRSAIPSSAVHLPGRPGGVGPLNIAAPGRRR